MELQDFQTKIESYLDKVLPVSTNAHDLAAAMRYSVLNNGKRLRPKLVLATGQLLNVPTDQLLAAAASVELIHCYSLVHDDLPAMDDDDLRRGKPTCHKVFGEAMAILAGDALQALAFEVLADPQLNPVDPAKKVVQLQILAQAAGARGMVLGQALDIFAENCALALEPLNTIHNNKTGALFRACVTLALQGSDQFANPATITALTDYALNLGLLFQIQDDILDVTSDSATLGKPVGSDQKLVKATYPSILGLGTARQHASNTLNKAITALQDFGAKALNLRNIANFALNRTF